LVIIAKIAIKIETNRLLFMYLFRSLSVRYGAFPS
jgi:hypothetical protein